MALKLITQPKDSVICGHCSIAMVTERDVETVIKELGINPMNGGGSTVEMHHAYLTKHGINFKSNVWMDNRKRIDLSGKGIMCITWGARNEGHAMAFEDGKIYDPAGNVFESLADMKRDYKQYVNRLKVYSVTTILE